jgi:glutathione-regulated potassium-efflux system protein KefB
MDVNHLMFVVAVMLIVSATAIIVARKLNLGSIIGLLAAGMLLGPHSPLPLLTGHVEELRAVGEIGVTLLLFAVALEIQPARLWSMRRLVFGLGGAQFALTTAAIVAVFVGLRGLWATPLPSALVASLALTMSSAAIPLPVLQARNDTGSPHGRAVLAIDIFQGFMVIPVLAVIPLLGGASQDTDALQLAVKGAEIVGTVGGVYLLGRYGLPWALTVTARSVGPGAFGGVVIAGVFLASWWMDTVGVSMALGAFMIGVLLSTAPYADQVKATVAPVKQLLLACSSSPSAWPWIFHRSPSSARSWRSTPRCCFS